MRSFLQRAGILFLLLCIVGASAGLVYALSSRSHTAVINPQASPIKPTPTLSSKVTATRTAIAKTCGTVQRNFQMGIVFPEWGTTAYGSSDSEWLRELPQMREQTAACWVEMPVLFYQASLTSTVVTTSTSTPTVAAFTSRASIRPCVGTACLCDHTLKLGWLSIVGGSCSVLDV